MSSNLLERNVAGALSLSLATYVEWRKLQKSSAIEEIGLPAATRTNDEHSFGGAKRSKNLVAVAVEPMEGINHDNNAPGKRLRDEEPLETSNGGLSPRLSRHILCCIGVPEVHR